MSQCDGTDLVQASEDVRKVYDGISSLVDLMEYVVAEELHNISITGFGPSWFACKSVAQTASVIRGGVEAMSVHNSNLDGIRTRAAR